ncbi:hypothetical protein F5Y15DRAFT_427998 [Xylariaceae sp. FL0016]|nr:hypothetical protein F5Y15DRAFT_427998 [Xylariaceae sp. FL0016]
MLAVSIMRDTANGHAMAIDSYTTYLGGVHQWVFDYESRWAIDRIMPAGLKECSCALDHIYRGWVPIRRGDDEKRSADLQAMLFLACYPHYQRDRSTQTWDASFKEFMTIIDWTLVPNLMQIARSLKFYVFTSHQDFAEGDFLNPMDSGDDEDLEEQYQSNLDGADTEVEDMKDIDIFTDLWLGNWNGWSDVDGKHGTSEEDCWP